MENNQKKTTILQTFGNLMRGSGKVAVSQGCGCNSTAQSNSCCSSSEINAGSAGVGEMLYSKEELSNSNQGVTVQGCGCGSPTPVNTCCSSRK